MNFLDTPLHHKNVFLRSSLYTSNNTADGKYNLIFELNEPINCDPKLNVLMSCDSFQFTNTFYTINQYNRYLYYVNQGTFNINSITLPLGNYTISGLISTLNASSSGIFTFSYNSTTYKITITSTTSTQFKLVDLDAQYNNIYEILGFDDYGTRTYNTTFTGPYLYNLISVQVLHICVPNINLENIYVRNTKKYNILASIHITSSFGAVQTWFNQSNFKYTINDPTITFLNIVVLDQDFNIVDFNNIDWFINISFQYITKKELNLNPTLQEHNNLVYSNDDVIDVNEMLEEQEDKDLLDEILNNNI